MHTETIAQAPARRAEMLLVVTELSLVAGGAIALLIPRLHALIPPCPFRSLTGLYCPGCGTGRMAQALVQGDVLAALRFNPVAFALIPVIGYALARDCLRVFGIARLPRILMSRVTVAAIPWLIAAYWIARNLPWPPFSWLSPG